MDEMGSLSVLNLSLIQILNCQLFIDLGITQTLKNSKERTFHQPKLFALMRFSLFCDVTQRWLVVSYRKFETAYRSQLKDSLILNDSNEVVPKRQ
jgi:hypothetical protein